MLLHLVLIHLFKIISVLAIIAIILLFYVWFGSVKQNVNIIEQNKITTVPKQKSLQTEDYSIIIQYPNFEAFTKKSQLYKITANQAIKINDHQYQLTKPSGELKFNHTDLLINAEYGMLNDDKQLIMLQHNVYMEYDAFTLNTEAVEINLTNEAVTGKNKAVLSYKSSKISADSFITNNNNNVIKFHGNVKLKINISDF
jgi:LPS export ABC transporter protein LptC